MYQRPSPLRSCLCFPRPHHGSSNPRSPPPAASGDPLLYLENTIRLLHSYLQGHNGAIMIGRTILRHFQCSNLPKTLFSRAFMPLFLFTVSMLFLKQQTATLSVTLPAGRRDETYLPATVSVSLSFFQVAVLCNFGRLMCDLPSSTVPVSSSFFSVAGVCDFGR